jgi:hypothetical protein
MRCGTGLVVASLVLASCGTGCTYRQLRYNTVNQMQTIHDLQQQQVLDNLAMFVGNRDAYPYYSVVTQGTCQLTDSGSLAITNGFGRSGLLFIYSSLGINPMASRQSMESWVINPVNDSVKLSLMRCVYRIAIEGCLGMSPDGCPNCQNLIQAYYGPWDTKSKAGPVKHAPEAPNHTPSVTPRPAPADTQRPAPSPMPPPAQQSLRPGKSMTAPFGPASFQAEPTAAQGASVPWPGGPMNLPPPGAAAGGAAPPQLTHVDGIVTPDCLRFKPCWFCSGSKKDVPKHCLECNMVGHYCGTYVWIPPEGRDQLTKLMLLIQDIAFYEPVSPSPMAPPGGPPGAVMATGRVPTAYPYTTLQTLQVLRAFTTPNPLSPTNSLP